ncbi:hypothetical protein GQ597_09635 [Gilliamella sp. Pra-s65]|uniref:hypothetical protein n=1 Tax=unclassified Gilliamella TaxID=2685620 RepID=UPI0013653FD1|nr:MULTISPECIES: hypothetical protein [unclassified Gilliamella]MWN90962.1 hypothetical protein [Gilliamella sp. Pra-s65]MWP74105.1 hypothetical protein [Gilliamella sp. Pra-s52]
MKFVLHYFILTLFCITCHIRYVNALSATTSNTIHGHAPYLTFDGGATKSDIKALLGIRLSNGQAYIPEGGESSLYPNATVIDYSDVIDLPDGMDTFDSVETLVPLSGNSNYPNIALNDLISTNHYWYDEDGDDNIDISGRLSLAWYDVSGNNVTDIVKENPTSKFDPCFAPYRLNLYVTKVQLSTQYGEPRENNIGPEWGGAHIYNFNPNMKTNHARVCFATPNDVYGMNGKNWSSLHGLEIKDVDNPEENFPTTGANELSFYLRLVGITPEQVINANGTTVSAVSGSSLVSLLLSSDEARLKITLKGPNKDSINKSFSPSLFKLYADSQHSQLLYSFKIERWYIIKPIDIDDNDNNQGMVDYGHAQEFCRDLGGNYRVGGIADYTNANYPSWMLGAPGQRNEFLRQLSYKSNGRWIGGLLNEWGKTYTFDTDDWRHSSMFWTSDSDGSSQYSVAGYNGAIIPTDSSMFLTSVCVTP